MKKNIQPPWVGKKGILKQRWQFSALQLEVRVFVSREKHAFWRLGGWKHWPSMPWNEERSER